MREQPHYENLLTKEFFEKHYVLERRSYTDMRVMLLKMGYNIHIGTLCNYAKKHGIGRNISEGKRNAQENPLDWNKSFLSENIIEAIDGFILGDGGIDSNHAHTAARLTCGVEYEEFCAYMMKYFSIYTSTHAKYSDRAMKQGYRWQGMTLHHPDLYKQYLRWYPIVGDKHDKQPPNDVRITPLSVMIWYLGDGSMVINEKANSIMLRISTDSFLPERVEYLVLKLKEKGIDCHRNNENRMVIDAKGIAAFFNFIGKESPISCYKYKFDVPEWRLTTIGMKEASDELGVSYNRLSYLVKIGQAPSTRLQDNGKPLFTREQIEVLRKMKEEGKLY